MTHTQMIAHLKWRLGKRSDLSAQTDLSVDMFARWANDSIQELSTKHYFWQTKFNWEFPELDTDDSATGGADTSDGVPWVTIPTTAIFIQDVWDSTNDRMLDWLSWGDYLQKPGRADTDKEGKPVYWARRGRRVYTYPTSDATYALISYFREYPADISGSDTNPLGSEWDLLVMELAAQKGFHHMRDKDGADECRGEFLRMAAEMSGIYTREERAGRKRVRMSHNHMHSYKQHGRRR